MDTAAKDLLFSTLRLITYSANGASSEGTGFIMDLELEPEHSTPVLVTNKHVIEGAEHIELQFALADDEGGVLLGQTQPVRIASGSASFLGHPDSEIDVAIAPIGAIVAAVPQRLFYRAVPMSLLPDEATLADLDAIEDLIFVGYPDGRWDLVNRTPLIRRGITATPVGIDFDGRPCFLIDGSVFAGSSGSPVFVYNSGGFSVGGKFAVGQRMLLVGVLTATLTRERALRFGELSSILEQELHLGMVFNWRAIRETIEALCKNAGIDPPW